MLGTRCLDAEPPQQGALARSGDTAHQRPPVGAECLVRADPCADHSLLAAVPLVQREAYVAVVEAVPAVDAPRIDAEELEAVKRATHVIPIPGGERLVGI